LIYFLNHFNLVNDERYYLNPLFALNISYEHILNLLAMSCKDYKIFELLVKNGADLNLANNQLSYLNIKYKELFVGNDQSYMLNVFSYLGFNKNKDCFMEL